MDFNSLKMNVVITVLVLFLVFLLPWADRRICRRLRLSLEGGLSENPNADRLLRLRRLLLIIGLTLYIFCSLPGLFSFPGRQPHTIQSILRPWRI